jgi:nitrogen-specific signal transduction histidine kinase/CheY-like chemotaxis protein
MSERPARTANPCTALPPGAVVARIEELEAQVRELTRKLEASERTLARSERLQALGQLISGVAHELANPMTAVIARSAFIRSATTLGEAQRQATLIEEQAQRATKIVRNLSAFARRRAAQRSAFSINDVVRSVLDLHGYQLAASSITVVEDLDHESAWVEGDQHEIEQVVLNIVVNAHYAMVHAHNEGTLTIRTRAVADLVHLSIADDGPGIPADVLPQVFDAFFTTKGEDGTGLGLAIARDTVVQHRGRISVDSSGTGTTILVELPRLRTARSRVAANTPVPTETKARRGPILVVDDEPEVGELIADLLRARGFDAECVSSAPAALDRVRSRAFTGVITDLRMPQMSGEDLWRVLRAERPLLARRTIFITGDHTAAATAATIESIGQPCLTKPFRATELDEALGALEAITE